MNSDKSPMRKALLEINQREMYNNNNHPQNGVKQPTSKVLTTNCNQENNNFQQFIHQQASLPEIDTSEVGIEAREEFFDATSGSIDIQAEYDIENNSQIDKKCYLNGTLDAESPSYISTIDESALPYQSATIPDSENTTLFKENNPDLTFELVNIEEDNDVSKLNFKSRQSIDPFSACDDAYDALPSFTDTTSSTDIIFNNISAIEEEADRSKHNPEEVSYLGDCFEDFIEASSIPKTQISDPNVTVVIDDTHINNTTTDFNKTFDNYNIVTDNANDITSEAFVDKFQNNSFPRKNITDEINIANDIDELIASIGQIKLNSGSVENIQQNCDNAHFDQILIDSDNILVDLSVEKSFPNEAIHQLISSIDHINSVEEVQFASALNGIDQNISEEIQIKSFDEIFEQKIADVQTSIINNTPVESALEEIQKNVANDPLVVITINQIGENFTNGEENKSQLPRAIDTGNEFVLTNAIALETINQILEENSTNTEDNKSQLPLDAGIVIRNECETINQTISEVKHNANDIKIISDAAPIELPIVDIPSNVVNDSLINENLNITVNTPIDLAIVDSSINIVSDPIINENINITQVITECSAIVEDPDTVTTIQQTITKSNEFEVINQINSEVIKNSITTFTTENPITLTVEERTGSSVHEQLVDFETELDRTIVQNKKIEDPVPPTFDIPEIVVLNNSDSKENRNQSIDSHKNFNQTILQPTINLNETFEHENIVETSKDLKNTQNTHKLNETLDKSVEIDQIVSEQNVIFDYKKETIQNTNERFGVPTAKMPEKKDDSNPFEKEQSVDKKLSIRTDIFDTSSTTEDNNMFVSKSSLTETKQKDIFVENFAENFDITFKTPAQSFGNKRRNDNGLPSHSNQINLPDEEFRSADGYQFAASDFDYLLSKGNNHAEEIDRNSVLLRFDPLLCKPVSFKQPIVKRLSVTKQTQEEEEESCLLNSLERSSSTNYDKLNINKSTIPEASVSQKYIPTAEIESKSAVPSEGKNATMSLGNMKEMIIDNDVKQQFDCTENKMSDQHQDQDIKMAELQKKIRNESLKIEDVEKKLKDAEMREEALLKRITEKDKTISKMSGVVEAYEKAIAELIAEKEQIIQSCEKKCTSLKLESDINAQHLESLEKTFSDLHAKYERTKQFCLDFKEREENLLSERKKNADNLRMQESRYEKMKSHAMTQLEIANNKLADLTRSHHQETTKLKALLKKEEISRASVNEQLIQKSKENEELVKICDELISGGGNC